jgi:hypothetical protein
MMTTGVEAQRRRPSAAWAHRPPPRGIAIKPNRITPVNNIEPTRSHEIARANVSKMTCQ